MSTAVAPCAKCRTTEGYAKPGYSRPTRTDGKKFGVEGVVCHRCHSALNRQLTKRGARAVKTKAQRPFVVDPAEHQGLVHLVALRFRDRGMDLDDLVGWGQIGLLKACQGFDASRDIQFSTYAAAAIRQTILREIRQRVPFAPVPEYLHRAIQHGPHLLRNPAQRELLDTAITHLSRETVADHQLEGSIASVVPAPEAGDPLEHAELVEHAHRILAVLPEREATVLRLRFGIDEREPWTLAEIGESLGVTRERARQIEVVALAKARQHMGVPA